MDDEHLYRRELLGDRAYIGHSTQLRLFEETGLTVHVPYRRNQKDYQAYNPILKLKLKTIEVAFSQYCDEYAIRQNYAKRFDGFEIRIITKVAAKTFKQILELFKQPTCKQNQTCFGSLTTQRVKS